jgi:hypothetical protein
VEHSALDKLSSFFRRRSHGHDLTLVLVADAEMQPRAPAGIPDILSGARPFSWGRRSTIDGAIRMLLVIRAAADEWLADRIQAG